MVNQRKSTQRIKDEIAQLELRLRQQEAREAQRLGTLAVKAGLHETRASETDLLKAMKDLTIRFRQAPPRNPGADRSKDR